MGNLSHPRERDLRKSVLNLILAEAPASGQGYRTISVVDAPYATQRSPGFPVLLIPIVYGFGMNVIIKAPDQLGLRWELLTYLEIIVTICILGLLLIGFFSHRLLCIVRTSKASAFTHFPKINPTVG
jgi:hypothetical protein